jgi:hypothetical protein
MYDSLINTGQLHPTLLYDVEKLAQYGTTSKRFRLKINSFRITNKITNKIKNLDYETLSPPWFYNPFHLRCDTMKRIKLQKLQIIVNTCALMEMNH